MINPDNLRQKMISSMCKFLTSYIKLTKEQKIIYSLSGQNVYFEFDKTIQGVVTCVYRSFINEHFDVDLEIVLSDFVCDEYLKVFSHAHKSCIVNSKSLFGHLQDIKGGGDKALVSLENFLVELYENYPFSKAAADINVKLRTVRNAKVCEALKCLFSHQKLTSSSRFVIFSYQMYDYDHQSYKRTFCKIAKALEAVEAECCINFGNGFAEFIESLDKSSNLAGTSFGSNSCNHIQIKVFQKHIRFSVTPEGFDSIVSFMLANGNDSMQEHASNLLEKLGECA